MGRENTLHLVDRIDALEVFNARCHQPRWDEEVDHLAQEQHLGRFAGSDAHTVWEVGRAITLIPPFHDADSLREALHHTRIEGKRSPRWVHLMSTGSKLLKKLGRAGCSGISSGTQP